MLETDAPGRGKGDSYDDRKSVILHIGKWGKGSPGLRGAQLYHADSVEIFAERFAGAAEGEFVPWDLFGSKQLRLQAFLVSAQLPADRGRGVDDDDDGARPL